MPLLDTIDTALTHLADGFGWVQQTLFEQLLQPVMFALGMGNLLEDGFIAVGWLMVGVLQIAVMLTVFRGLERLWPAEPLTDRRAIRVDVIYTLIHRLGIFRVVLFFTLDPLWDTVIGQLRLWGLPSFHLDNLWPGVTDVPVLCFVLYLVLFDGVNYALHRAQHAFDWWWALHSLHHSQRQMTLWSDNRNHLLDSILLDSAFVLTALAVGVPPGQFVAVIAVGQLLESLSHANVQLPRNAFTNTFGRLFVGPRFHRWHHGIGVGHESHGPGTLGGHNFAVLFPVWDLIFRTADYSDRVEPTGVRDQLPGQDAKFPQGRNYGEGFWAQQWLGLLRLCHRA